MTALKNTYEKQGECSLDLNHPEFINYVLLEFCKLNAITFTRSRPYKKNDQAHVEEKNGSIIRRLIGYDRYEGLDAYNALSELYAVLRLYVNFFQPSLKLLSKKRDGAKVTKKYHKAKTPYQRLMLSPHLTEIEKEKLEKQYIKLDPIDLQNRLVKLQDNFWKHAWKPSTEDLSSRSNTTTKIIDELINLEVNEVKNVADTHIDVEQQAPEHPLSSDDTKQSPCNIRRYRKTNKPRKSLEPRTWRTRALPHENLNY